MHLRKVSVLKKIDSSTYEGEDVLDGTIVEIFIKGKLRMNYIKLPIGLPVFVVMADSDDRVGGLVIEKYLCFDNQNAELCRQKRAIEERERQLKS